MSSRVRGQWQRRQQKQQRQRDRRPSSGSGSLNQRMRAARTAAELLDLLGDQDISSLSLIDASTAVHVLARQRLAATTSARYTSTLNELLRHVEEHTVPNLTNDRTILTLLWAIAKLQGTTGTCLKASAVECISHKGLDLLGSCDGRGVATVAWSIAQLRKEAPSLCCHNVTLALEQGILRLVHETNPASPGFDAHSLATIAWACGAIRCRNRTLLHKLGDHALRCLEEFTTQGLQNIATAFAKCCYSAHGELLKSLKVTFLQRISEFDAQGLSAFSWAFQRLQPGQNVDLVLASTQALCAFANQRTGGSAAAAESVTQSLLAVATLLAAPNSRPRRLYTKFRPVILDLLERCQQAQCDKTFDMPQISTTVSSFAKLVGCIGLFENSAEWLARRAKLTGQLKTGLLRVLGQSQAQDLAIVLWGLARLHGCSGSGEQHSAKPTLFAPPEAAKVLHSVQQQLMSFNWRSMGLMDYAVQRLLVSPRVALNSASSSAIDEWEKLRQTVEEQRRERASVLISELHSMSELAAKQPWALTVDVLTRQSVKQRDSLTTALLKSRVLGDGKERATPKCRVLLFDDSTGEVGNIIKRIAATHSVQVELSGCMRYACAASPQEATCFGTTAARDSSRESGANDWNAVWTRWEQQMVADKRETVCPETSDQCGSVQFDCCLMRYPGTFGRDSSESFAMALSSVACRLPVGAVFLLCGLLEETVTSGIGGGNAADSAKLTRSSATQLKLPSSLRNCLSKWFTAASIVQHRDDGLDGGRVVLVQAKRNSTHCPVESGRVAAWAIDSSVPRLQRHPGRSSLDHRSWRTFPGLFSGGTLSDMTQNFLNHVPTPQSGSTVLDFACGSGLIGSALLEKQPSIALHMLDADSVATEAVRHNVPSARAIHLSDGWASVDPSLRFDLIVSNPPVHSGIADDLEVLKGLVQGAAPRDRGGGGRLKPGGILCLITQTQIPTGCLLHANGFDESQYSFVDCEGGHFLVWTATVEGDVSGAGGESCEEKFALADDIIRRTQHDENELQDLLHRGDITELTKAKFVAAAAEDYDRAALLKRHIEELQDIRKASPADSAIVRKLARKRKRKEKQKQRKLAATRS